MSKSFEEKLDTILGELSDDAKAKVKADIKKAVKADVKASVKKKMKQRRRRFVRRVLFVGAIAGGAYLIYTHSEKAKTSVDAVIAQIPDKARTSMDTVIAKIPVKIPDSIVCKLPFHGDAE